MPNSIELASWEEDSKEKYFQWFGVKKTNKESNLECVYQICVFYTKVLSLSPSTSLWICNSMMGIQTNWTIKCLWAKVFWDLRSSKSLSISNCSRLLEWVSSSLDHFLTPMHEMSKSKLTLVFLVNTLEHWDKVWPQ
jgi:hypothetical protein